MDWENIGVDRMVIRTHDGAGEVIHADQLPSGVTPLVYIKKCLYARHRAPESDSHPAIREWDEKDHLGAHHRDRQMTEVYLFGFWMPVMTKYDFTPNDGSKPRYFRHRKAKCGKVDYNEPKTDYGMESRARFNTGGIEGQYSFGG